MAFEHHSYESSYYFDKETGKVQFLPDEYFGYPETSKDVISAEMPGWQADLVSDARQVDATPGRYIRIEPIPSSEAYRIMEDFIGTVDKEWLKRSLWLALQGSKPFLSFKNALLGDIQEHECWFQFKNDHFRVYALDWLASIGIEPG